ncbi:SRPBCC family protein [Pseudonocardia pini]|uniref:SRPBCC family protein n=1 Tax=Pseudonocardia pini TaxID=2758030 RepID=UPI0015F0EE04|nr:SRPBCC domain-containing protein [Pseudonocardia pini]
MTEPTGSTPRIEVTVSAPPERAWAALRDRDLVHQWHGWQYDDLGAEIDTIFFTGVVEEVPGRSLVLGDGDRFDVLPAGEGARIVLTRAPLGGNPEWDAYYDDVTEGWISFLHQLAFALDRHPADVRRTLFHSRDECVPVDLVTAAPGDPYALTLQGEELTGRVWFRSAHQLGLTVDGWGDGLLVVAGLPPSERALKGSAMAILTTYGLSEEAFAALDERWSAWGVAGTTS